MSLLLIGLFVGVVLGVVGTKLFGKKIEDTIEADEKELVELEAKYGAKVKNVVDGLSGDLRQVIERYHYLKNKLGKL